MSRYRFGGAKYGIGCTTRFTCWSLHQETIWPRRNVGAKGRSGVAYLCLGRRVPEGPGGQLNGRRLCADRRRSNRRSYFPRRGQRAKLAVQPNKYSHRQGKREFCRWKIRFKSVAKRHHLARRHRPLYRRTLRRASASCPTIRCSRHGTKPSGYGGRRSRKRHCRIVRFWQYAPKARTISGGRELSIDPVPVTSGLCGTAQSEPDLETPLS
jgi:hypothetical protein